MQKVLDDLFHLYNSGRNKYTEEIHRINCNRGNLRKNFNKWQAKMLLRIEDDKDLIAAKWADDSFSEGIKIGVMFMTEVFRDDYEHE